MAYCSLADVLAYSGVPANTDEALITALITRAQAWIDLYTGRTFEASQDAARYIGMDAVDGRTLYIYDDLCAITSIVSGGTTLEAAHYITEPRGKTPYSRIVLLASSNLSWTYATDPENAVLITGRWAYSTTAPADIAHACIRLATFLYRQKDASTFDTTAIPDAGVILTPQGMPRDVKIILDPYRRHL